ncbi:GNAT family N-acetyltransferase [Streptomyces sp. NPDC050388]|uniref:GNAT family N-acetyltransferase n=1 Tax=Streptomyces sp. NPDC050388 TaxID=3155781 RepID=UPI003449AB14
MAEIAGPWDALPSSLYGTSPWLTMQEGHFAQGCAYVMVSTTEGPRVATVSYTMGPSDWELVNPVALLTRDAPSPPEAGEERNSRVENAVRLLRGAKDSLYPAAVSVLPAGYRPGLLHADDAQPAEFDAALRLLERKASESGMPTTAVMHVPAADTKTRTALEERGYIPFTTAADCVLDLEWESLDDYLASFSKSRRAMFRRDIRAFRGGGFQVVPADPRSMSSKHVALLVSQMAQYGHAPDPAGITELVERVIRHVGEACVLLEVHRNGSLEAFVLSYEDNGILQPRMLGLDPEARKHSVYLNLVYYELIAHGIRTGAQGISYGPETYEAKALRGCRPDLRVNYVRLPDEYQETGRVAAEAVDFAHRLYIRNQPWRNTPDVPARAG